MSNLRRELIATYSTVKDLIKHDLSPMNVHCDNKAAIMNAEIDSGKKLKHVTDKLEHYVKECVKRGLVKINWIKSTEQKADIFTKSFSLNKHKHLVNLIFNNVSSVTGKDSNHTY